MKTAIYDQSKLPRFLLGDSIQDNPDQLWIIHNHYPCFIGRIDEDEVGVIDINEIQFKDPLPESPEELEQLTAQAVAWLTQEFRLQNLNPEETEEW